MDLRIYLLEAKYELLKLARLPAYALPTIGFPLLFYTLFAVTFGKGKSMGGVDAAAAMLANYGAFGVIGAALFGFGVGVAVERGQGWTLLKRASPMPPGAGFCAKIAMSLIFSTAIVISMSILATTLAGVRLPAGEWLALGGVLVAGALPFCAMGLAFGTLCGPNSAPAVVNLVYLPMAFASGLWIPVQMLPGFLQTIAPFMPPYHLGQLALKTIGADLGRPVALHLAALAAVTVGSLALAGLASRREERTYG
jgi:ABC-2 type transport system permease protein